MFYNLCPVNYNFWIFISSSGRILSGYILQLLCIYLWHCKKADGSRIGYNNRRIYQEEIFCILEYAEKNKNKKLNQKIELLSKCIHINTFIVCVS